MVPMLLDAPVFALAWNKNFDETRILCTRVRDRQGDDSDGAAAPSTVRPSLFDRYGRVPKSQGVAFRAEIRQRF
jgi:hypothetical protein